MFIPFVYIAQCVVCAQRHKLLVTNKSEAMGNGRNLSSEKITQDVALDNFSYCQIRVLGCGKGALKKCKQLYRQTGCLKDKPGRGDLVSQLITEKQLSHSDSKIQLMH